MTTHAEHNEPVRELTPDKLEQVCGGWFPQQPAAEPEPHSLWEASRMGWFYSVPGW
jgi:hypothetical protein